MSPVQYRSRCVACIATCWLTAIPFGAPQTSQTSPDPVERFVRILELKGSGDYARALAEAKELALRNTDLAAVHRTVADLYIELGDVEGAREFYEGWVERDPQSARARYGLARMNLHEGELENAIEQLKRAIALDPNFAEPFGLRGGLAQAYELDKDLGAGVDYFEELTRTTNDPANAYAGLGWSFARLFQFDDAIDAFRRSVELEPRLVQAHAGLVQSYFRTGRYQSGLKSCQDLRTVAESSGDLEMVAYAAMVQGSIAWVRGDYREALSRLQEAQRVAREIGDTAREAVVVNNTAAVYATAGEYDRALQHFERGLEIARRTESTQTEVIALINIGSVHKLSGNFHEALGNYREAVELARNAGYANRQCEALANMGEAFHLAGRHDEALGHYRDALRIAEETQNKTIEAFVLGLLGSLSRDRDDYDNAIQYFERELALGEETGEIEAIWEAQAGLGSTFENRGDFDRAIAHYAKAIESYDAVRESLAIESIGASFLDDKHGAYPSIVTLLAGKGEFEQAFLYAEKYKAKGFLDILARGKALFETQLPEELRRELDRIAADLQESYAESSRASSIALEERITQLELRKANLVDRVRQEHGDFFELALSEPLEVSAIQNEVVEQGQVLLQYVIGAEQISVFVVSRDELRHRFVPVGRAELRELLEELSPLFVEGKSRTRILNAELADFSLAPARALYETLIAPVAEWLPETGELIIVPDDFLFYLPFELLVIESERAEHRYDFSAATFLIDRYAVSYSASASLLDPGLRRERTFEKGVLAFGNVTSTSTSTSTSNGQPPLPNSQTEVEAIDEAFDDFDNGIFTRESATKDVFIERAADYGVLHFATHFSSDDRQPLYSSFVLSGEEGLRTYEVFGAELNAELAVLSACNTGLGKLAKGEGLIGITRAFLYAGVPSLVVSLWSVDDESTSRIMELFYRHLRAGERKKQALRHAKLDYLREASDMQKDPFYWAPFVLNGDGRPLTLTTLRPEAPRWRPHTPLVLALVLVFVLGLAALLVWRRRTARG